MSYSKLSAPADTSPPRIKRIGSIRLSLPSIPFVLTLGLLPVYLFPSGLPQLVDIPIILLLVYSFISRSKTPKLIRRFFLSLALFVSWVFLVNFAYFIFYPFDYSLLYKNLEILYSIMILIGFSSIFIKFLESKNISLIYIGIIISMILIYTMKGVGDQEARSALSFNNPNQLGYYALYMASMAIMLIYYKYKFDINKIIYYWLDALIIIISNILAIMSWSRGAMLGLACLNIYIILKRFKNIIYFLLPVLMAVIILIIWRPSIIQERLTYQAGKPISPEIAQQELEERLFYQLSIMKGIEYLVGRGGRGFTFREKARGILEVHNIFGEIFRSYGAIGLGLFGAWLGQTIWATRIVPGSLWIWAGLLIYNMTHYGLRFRSFWILTALLYALMWLTKQQNDSAALPATSDLRNLQAPPKE